MKEGDLAMQQGVVAARRLIAPGVLGFYTHVEVTEVVAFIGRDPVPVNVFTLLVAEERIDPPPLTPGFLNSTRITLPGLRDWRFGICRYVLPMSDAMAALEGLEQQAQWAASGKALVLSPLVACPVRFVPPNHLDDVPFNGVLKNNFWNGSHVIEWVDSTKDRLRPFFDEPQHLQQLSDGIRKWLPLHLASVSDRLGNVVLQLPVTVVMANFQGTKDGLFQANVAWHPNAVRRTLRATVDVEFDGMLTGYFNREVGEGSTLLPTPSHPGLHRAYLWDCEHELVLTATGRAAFIRSIDLSGHMVEPEPRTFRVKTSDGTMLEQRVPVQHSTQSLIGRVGEVSKDDWTDKRIRRGKTSRLAEERRFMPYRPAPDAKQAEHQRALSDIRELVARYGTEGAWLWDPYLSAGDLLNTLFYCPHAGVDLRGLTAMEQPKDGEVPLATGAYFERQRQALIEAQGNAHGLRLEYRAKSGMAGWAFHDRFIIFPREEQMSLVWSLGTSVNSLGKALHVVQRVDDGQQVKEAFVDLWDRLGASEHLIWKSGAA